MQTLRSISNSPPTFPHQSNYFQSAMSTPGSALPQTLHHQMNQSLVRPKIQAPPQYPGSLLHPEQQALLYQSNTGIKQSPHTINSTRP